MYNEILYPTDGSEPAESVLEYALQIASEHEATIHILNVADTNRDSLTRIQGQVIDVLEREGDRIVDETAQRATERGIDAVSKVVQGTPSTSIVEYCDQFDIDLIVMPTHGRRGLKRVLIGSVTERVINTAEVPVITVDPDRNRSLSYPCQDLLVPIDGSHSAALALREGIAVAKATGAVLHLLHVVETGGLVPDDRSALKDGELTERADTILTDATERAKAESLAAVETEIEVGSPVRKIRSYIQESGIDLAVLGTQGETNVSRYVMGGVSAQFVRTSPIPVMWVRQPE